MYVQIYVYVTNVDYKPLALHLECFLLLSVFGWLNLHPTLHAYFMSPLILFDALSKQILNHYITCVCQIQFTCHIVLLRIVVFVGTCIFILVFFKQLKCCV